jgi:hypothetical protein
VVRLSLDASCYARRVAGSKFVSICRSQFLAFGEEAGITHLFLLLGSPISHLSPAALHLEQGDCPDASHLTLRKLQSLHATLRRIRWGSGSTIDYGYGYDYGYDYGYGYGYGYG